jgi:hypothetical protein
VSAFGTKKAIKKVTSMLTNMVDESGGGSNSPAKANNKGVRDKRLKDMAQQVQEGQLELKKDIMSSANRRQNLYNKDLLLP